MHLQLIAKNPGRKKFHELTCCNGSILLKCHIKIQWTIQSDQFFHECFQRQNACQGALIFEVTFLQRLRGVIQYIWPYNINIPEPLTSPKPIISVFHWIFNLLTFMSLAEQLLWRAPFSHAIKWTVFNWITFAYNSCLGTGFSGENTTSE